MLPLIFSIIILCLVPGYKASHTSGKRTGIRVLSILNIIFAAFNVFTLIGLVMMLTMRGSIDDITAELYGIYDPGTALMMRDMIQMIFDMAPVLLIITLATTIFYIATAVYGLKSTKLPAAVYGTVYQQPEAYYTTSQNNGYNGQNGAPAQQVCPDQPAQPVQPQQEQPAAQQEQYEWYCSNCGKMNPESANFCPYCGSARPRQ